MEDENINSQKLSRINAAGLINLTLKGLWDDFYRHLRQGVYIKANADLDCLWVEFSGDLNPETSDEMEEFRRLEANITKSFTKFKTERKGFSEYSSDERKGISSVYKALIEKAIFLRKLQNNQGKGTAYQDSSTDYMDS